MWECFCTSCYPQHSHDPDDGGVYGKWGLLDFLQSDTHDGEQHDDQVQLVPPSQKCTRQPSLQNKSHQTLFRDLLYESSVKDLMVAGGE